VEPFLGQIQLFPYNFAPRGWAPCDGRTLAISTNTALFSLIGTNFGGDGVQNYALPKLAGPSAAIGYYIALQGVYPPRE
jgi:microcystin-dependent protein